MRIVESTMGFACKNHHRLKGPGLEKNDKGIIKLMKRKTLRKHNLLKKPEQYTFVTTQWWSTGRHVTVAAHALNTSCSKLK